MGCRTIAGREDLSRDDESGGVGAEVLEEVGKAVQGNESADGVRLELVVAETLRRGRERERRAPG